MPTKNTFIISQDRDAGSNTIVRVGLRVAEDDGTIRTQWHMCGITPYVRANDGTKIPVDHAEIVTRFNASIKEMGFPPLSEEETAGLIAYSALNPAAV